MSGFLAARRAAETTRRRLQAGPMERILVVCYGNIYRSAILGEYLRTRLGPLAAIRSAGFHRVADRPSPPRHVELARTLGVSLDQHRSAVVSDSDLQWADTIVLMDRHNWDALENQGADDAKYVWIGALGQGEVEIVDPYTLTDGASEVVIRRLLQCGEAFAGHVEKNSKGLGKRDEWH